MSAPTTPIWVEVWTLTVITPDSSFGPHVTLHTTERDALFAFRENFDPEREGPFVPEDPDLFDEYVKAVEDFFCLHHVEVEKHHVTALMAEEKYRDTHVSVHDGSPAMLVSQDHGTITLVNEDGFQWTDPIDDWNTIG